MPCLSVRSTAAPIVLAAMSLGACSSGSDEGSAQTTTKSTEPATTEPATTPETSPATTVQSEADLVDVRLVTVGAAEVVFDWTTDRCASLDIPDLPVRAFRDAAGEVQMISPHLDTRRSLGPSLDEVVHQCDPVVHHSTYAADPANFADNEWIASPYTADGQTVFAVMHQEFHGWEHGLTCPGENFSCWYNSLTMAVSYDGGLSYAPVVDPPGHLVASAPQPYEAGAGPYGVFEPSNIIARDGAYYLMVRMDEIGSDSQRICLLRTTDLSDPAGWRYWDGADFTIPNVDPYTDPVAASEAAPCAGLDGDLGIMDSSVVYVASLDAYVLVGITATFLDDREVWGVLYSFSHDLVHWSPRQLLAEVELPWTYQPGDGAIYLYPSLLDPDSDDRNFATTDGSAYVYLTRFNEGGDPLDRDLIRIPVQLFEDPAAADAAAVPFSG
ncbi:hypothetical protein BH10ACT2_BH10ACT2_16630 [soil metagenome]